MNRAIEARASAGSRYSCLVNYPSPEAGHDRGGQARRPRFADPEGPEVHDVAEADTGIGIRKPIDPPEPRWPNDPGPAQGIGGQARQNPSDM